MATTTNYGWTTPDDTALVKDGASAIRTLGSSVDTTTKALNPSTTLGDIEYRSSTANTNTRLGIGSTNQVLTVTGGVPAWADISAGGMTLISTTTMSGTSVTLSSIPQTYNSLFLVISEMTWNTSNQHFTIKPNNADNAGAAMLDNASGILYDASAIKMSGSTATVFRVPANNAWTLQINNYKSTTGHKPFISYGGFQDENANNRFVGNFGKINTTSAISSLVFSVGGQTLTAGTILLYGVK
jgi:hypothetical protein